MLNPNKIMTYHHLQTILFLQRFYLYLLIVKYFSLLKDKVDTTGPIFAEPIDSPLGFGWTAPFFVKIVDGDTFIDADGRYYTFKKDASGNFLTDTASGMTLKKTATGFTLIKLDAFTRTFDANGRLLTKRNREKWGQVLKNKKQSAIDILCPDLYE